MTFKGRMILGIVGLAVFAVSPRANGRQNSSAEYDRVLEQQAFKVGGGVTPPKPIKKVEPQFAESAKRAKIWQDTVGIRMIVTPDGTPRRLRIATPGVDPFEDRLAIAAVARWRFAPSLKDGQPVSVWVQVEVTFIQGVVKHSIDWKKAIEAYEKDALRGQAEAQCSLGNIYYRQKDFEHAKDCYTLAAKQGLSQAEYALGMMYKNGEGVTQDPEEARRWLEKSADHTDDRLGIMDYRPPKENQ